MFEYFWDNGLGNDLYPDGSPTPWTATTLESAFGGTTDKRSIEKWHARTNMPSPDNIRKLSVVASGGDHALRKQWYEALMAARRALKRQVKDNLAQKKPAEMAALPAGDLTKQKQSSPRLVLGFATLCLILGLVGWNYIGAFRVAPQSELVQNIRICDAAFFDDEVKKCSKHVSVFVHGEDEVFLSFDFVNVADGTPFERWWILNGERVAGRTSFNDVAWPGYTFWRPGVLKVGQYVVRIVVEDQVYTQVFTVQPDGFVSGDDT